MACGCSNPTSSTSGIPFLFKGGGKRKKSRVQRKQTKQKPHRRSKSKSKSKKSKRSKRYRQGGGVGIVGDMAPNAVNFANSLTGSMTANSSIYIQPAGKSFGNGNGYMV